MSAAGSLPRVVSVNVGHLHEGAWTGRMGSTGIDKRPVAGPVAVHELGVEGDVVVDTAHHGGPWQAVYAFAEEDLERWSARLGVRMPPGSFGENLTTRDLDVNEALVGEHWRIGTALVSPCTVRIPCAVFKNWVGRAGADDRAWQRRFTAENRPGPYLRVLEPGVVRAGDRVVVEHLPAHAVTVATMFRALTTEPDLLPRLLDVDGVPPAVHEQARKRLQRV